MSGMCSLCGGLVPASNETLCYSGPLCPGNHVLSPTLNSFNITLSDGQLKQLARRVANELRILRKIEVNPKSHTYSPKKQGSKSKGEK